MWHSISQNMNSLKNPVWKGYLGIIISNRIKCLWKGSQGWAMQHHLKFVHPRSVSTSGVQKTHLPAFTGMFSIRCWVAWLFKVNVFSLFGERVKPRRDIYNNTEIDVMWLSILLWCFLLGTHFFLYENKQPQK